MATVKKPRRKICPIKTALTRSPLLLSCEESNKSLVVELVLQGTDVNDRDSLNWTALHHASYKGWLDVAELLVRKGAELDVTSEEGDTPLLLAAQLGHESIALLLINAGADIKCCDTRNKSVLFYALQKGLLEVLQLLHERGVDFNARMPSGEIPLLVAAKNTKKQTVQFLMKLCVNLNISNEDDWTVLHYASREKWTDVVRYILERGGDVNATTSAGNTPLHCAFYSNLIAIWLDRKYRHSFAEVVELLCSTGADTNARNYEGSTPSLLAFHSHLVRSETWLKLKVFNCLFKAGADCNLAEDGNESLFDLFVSSGDIDLVRLGIENGGYFEDEISPDEQHGLKEGILRDVNLCTRALINQYNEKDLPNVYELCHLSDNFPSIKNMKITYESGATRDIEEAVRRDMEKRGYCNVLQVTPMALSMLTVKSILSYFTRIFNDQ